MVGLEARKLVAFLLMASGPSALGFIFPFHLISETRCLVKSGSRDSLHLCYSLNHHSTSLSTSFWHSTPPTLFSFLLYSQTLRMFLFPCCIHLLSLSDTNARSYSSPYCYTTRSFRSTFSTLSLYHTISSCLCNTSMGPCTISHPQFSSTLPPVAHHSATLLRITASQL